MSCSGLLAPSRRTGRQQSVRPRRARNQLAAAASVATLLVAGCGSSDGSDAGSNGKLTTLTINAAFFGPVDVPLMYAQEKGFYAAQGIEVKFVTASSNTQLAAVLGGSVQFASTSTLNVIKAAANGAKFVNFMPIEIGYSEDVIMSKDAYAASGLTANSTVKEKIAALANKKLGVISATGENAIIFKYLFNQAGIPTSNLQMVQLGMPQAILAALKQGKIAGANIGSPYPANAVSDGYAQYLFRAPLADIPPMNEAVTQTLATTESYYNSHKDLIKKFLAGYQKGLDAMNTDPDGTAQVVAAKYFPDQPNFMSSFKDDLPIIAKSLQITTAQHDALKKIATAAGVNVPANWDSFFVTP